MIEVTDEMKNLIEGFERSGNYAEDVAKRIIELHEQSKPKPEPVVWVVWNGWKPVGVTLDEEKAITYAQSKQQHSDLSGDFNAYRVAPFYTTPPTREPLSEEEIEKLVPWQGDSKDPFFNRIEFARAIEQAHGIGVGQ